MRCRLTLAVAIFTAMSNSTAAQRDLAEAAARIHQMERTLADAMHTRDGRRIRSSTVTFRVAGFEGTDMRTAAALVFSWRDRSSPR
jgi:hypothetical protein